MFLVNVGIGRKATIMTPPRVMRTSVSVNVTFRFSRIHRNCFGRTELLFRQLFFKLSPSLKFLSSHNSLRNFFSPSRGEIKMFRKFKLKNLSIFLNNSNLKRPYLFASWHLCISTHATKVF